MKWHTANYDSFGSGIAVSLMIHGLILAALLINLPAPGSLPEPDEQVVEVTLVEPPKPAVELAEPEAPQQPEEVAPEPELAEQPLPEQQPPEQASSKPPLTEVAPPDPQAPEEQTADRPVEEIPVLQPVFRFGERDSGPRKALDGTSANEPERQTRADLAEPSPPGNAVSADDAADDDATEAEAVEPPEAGRVLPELALPEADLADRVAAVTDSDVSAPGLSQENVSDPTRADAAPPVDETDSVPDAETSSPQPLTEAERLFSPVLTEDRAAMVAMGGLPRKLRASQLCTTELREQLRNGPTRFKLQLLPSYALKSGNVLAVSDAAFLADGNWYDLSFRCTVDDNAFQVIEFATAVGKPIPREQWQARGFPDY